MRFAAFAVIVAASDWAGDSGMSCGDPSAARDSVAVSWSIPGGPGSRGIELVGCGDWTSDLDAGSATLGVGWQPCSVRAWRKDGALRVLSQPVRVDGDETSLHISFDDLPRGPIGGVGAEVRAAGAGVRLERILSGTPAERAGMRAGEVVVAVDGRSTQDMSTVRFVRVVTGELHTPVTLRIEDRHGESWRDVTLVRESIPGD